MKLRAYQRKAVRGARGSIESGKHPLVVMPTGSGKSIVLCGIIDDYLSSNIEKDIVVLSHRSKILQQDYDALERYFEGLEVGLYSAGLGSRTIKKITVAGIQSVWRKAEEFVDTGLVIIDEAHLINHKGEGMYKTFLDEMAELGAQYVGLTATHFRLGHGYIHKGEGVIFNDLPYDLSSTANYNKLVDDGWLSPMYPRNTRLKVDTSKLGVRGGEFKNEDSSKVLDRDSVTDVICNEIIEVARENKSKKWLLFAINIEHAEHINQKMISLGITSAVVHSEMDGDKDVIISLWEDGIYTCLINVELLTTGLDVPSIDLIGVLRPTKSAALHVQMLGRGGRPVYADGYDLTTRKGRKRAIRKGIKPFCTILDFAGNIERIGPINGVVVEEKKDGSKGQAKTKVCPMCQTVNRLAATLCDCCLYDFTEKTEQEEKGSGLDLQSSSSEIMKSKSPNHIQDGWTKVDNVAYRIHSKPGKPSSLLVEYHCGRKTIKEYVCIDHHGYAKQVANHWLDSRVKKGNPVPRNLSGLYSVRADLKVPRKIKISNQNGWNVIKEFKF